MSVPGRQLCDRPAAAMRCAGSCELLATGHRAMSRTSGREGCKGTVAPEPVCCTVSVPPHLWVGGREGGRELGQPARQPIHAVGGPRGRGPLLCVSRRSLLPHARPVTFHAAVLTASVDARPARHESACSVLEDPNHSCSRPRADAHGCWENESLAVQHAADRPCGRAWGRGCVPLTNGTWNRPRLNRVGVVHVPATISSAAAAVVR
nr:hypothetical protein CFP56_30133 [Quercus suber]